jgi:hypothetical protein
VKRLVEIHQEGEEPYTMVLEVEHVPESSKGLRVSDLGEYIEPTLEPEPVASDPVTPEPELARVAVNDPELQEGLLMLLAGQKLTLRHKTLALEALSKLEA